MDKVLHTPEGVRDIYNTECERKISLETKLQSVIRTYGFKDIQTPTFEYFDIFSEERGTVSANYMYKFFDREGNTMVLRPDITPSIARCVAKYYKNETKPIRLCYLGNTYLNNHSYQGKLKETTQMGAELINDASIDADAEMIAMSIRCLLASGLTEFQIEIGHVFFFKALAEEAGLTMEEEEELRLRIEDKNMFGVEEILAAKDISEELKRLFYKMPELFGPLETLSEIKTMTNNPKAVKAIECLEQIYELLGIYGLEKYISFDLGMLSMYNYYTSIIFRAYTYGTGDSVLGGGRYNHLVGQFGKEAPAIGMAINIDQLMAALTRQKKWIDKESDRLMILYDVSNRTRAIQIANQYREQKRAVEIYCPEEEIQLESLRPYLMANHIKDLIILREKEEAELIHVGDSKQLSDGSPLSDNRPLSDVDH